MGNSIYTIDVVKTDGSTHFTKNVQLSDEQAVFVQTFINHIHAFAVACTSATMTKLSPVNAQVPVGYDAWKQQVEVNLGIGNKHGLIPFLP